MRLVTLYQVYDRRARNMLGPIMAGQNEVAIARELSDHVNNDQTIIGKHPDDFDLVSLGRQDMDTGVIDAEPTPVFVFAVRDLVRKDTPSNRPHGYIPPEG